MAFKRSDRLKELFLREITSALKGVGGLNANGILTVTGADLTKDGKILYVYYSVLGSQRDRERTALILNGNIWDIRGVLRSRLRLRYIPELVFKFDDTPEKAAKMEDLFTRLEAEKKRGDEHH